MAEKKDLLTWLKDLNARLSVTQKFFILLTGALIVAFVIFLVNLISSPAYGVLFTNLSIRDSGAIIEKLKEQKIPYRLEADGTVIRVPQNQVAELRINLAAEGLPEGGGVGFEIFDKSSLGVNDFVQNINYLRALEGELSRSIMQLKEVAAAKVHITMPKKSVFLEEEQPAKASVILKLRPGAALSSSIVPAISHLVAQSVEGLTPNNVAVIDIYGRLLSRPRAETDAFESSASEQLLYQKKVEQEFKQKIVELLEPIVGIGKVRTDVRVQLDFNRIELKEEIVDPNSVLKVSEQSEVSSSSSEISAGGVPGVSSNVASAAANNPAGGGNSGKSKTEKSVVNYDYSKKTVHQVKPLGEIRSISAAVVVDDETEVVSGKSGIEKKRRPRSEDELSKIEKIVKAAIGFNAERGDVVEVSNLSFDSSLETETQYLIKEQKSTELIQTIVRYGIYLLAILLFFLFILRPMLKRSTQLLKGKGIFAGAGSRELAEEELELPKVDLGKMAEIQKAKEEIEIEKELMEKYRIPKEAKKMAILKEKLQETAKSNPDQVASLIRSFLMENK